jgi:hypothetical protein
MRVATFPTEEASSLTLLYRVTNNDSGGDGNDDDDVVTVVAIRIVAMVVKYAEAGVDANVSAMLHNSSLFSGYQSRLFQPMAIRQDGAARCRAQAGHSATPRSESWRNRVMALRVDLMVRVLGQN